MENDPADMSSGIRKGGDSHEWTNRNEAAFTEAPDTEVGQPPEAITSPQSQSGFKKATKGEMEEEIRPGQETGEGRECPWAYTKVRPWVWGSLVAVGCLGMPLLAIITGRAEFLLAFFLTVPFGLLADYLAWLSEVMSENRKAGPFKRRTPLVLFPQLLHVSILMTTRFVAFTIGIVIFTQFDGRWEWVSDAVALLVGFLSGFIIVFAISGLARFIPTRCPTCQQPAWMTGGWIFTAEYSCNNCGCVEEYEMYRS